MARILLIVGGGIAAFKAAELIRTARKAGHSVTPVLTSGGSHFVTPMSLAALAESPVYTSLWDLKDEAEMGHIQLSRAADLVVVAPATADLIAKMAAGFADEAILSLLLSFTGPLVVAPAMETHMWSHPATQQNIATLRSRGVVITGPVEGPLASGRSGAGRLAEVDDVVEAAVAALTPKDLAGVKALVTAGPTVEDIDPVFTTTRLSIAPLRYGAGVKGKVNLAMSYGVPVVATSAAVEGMHLANGVDVLVADHPNTFADAIAAAYRDEKLWSRLSRAGVDNVRRHFSRDAAKRALAGVLGL